MKLSQRVRVSVSGPGERKEALLGERGIRGDRGVCAAASRMMGFRLLILKKGNGLYAC